MYSRFQKIAATKFEVSQEEAEKEGLSQEDALESEKEFIMASEPEFNVVHNQKNNKSRKFRKYTI